MLLKLGKAELLLMTPLKNHTVYSNVYAITECQQYFSDYNNMGNTVGRTAG